MRDILNLSVCCLADNMCGVHGDRTAAFADAFELFGYDEGAAGCVRNDSEMCDLIKCVYC